jgi:homoaconitate hydratase
MAKVAMENYDPQFQQLASAGDLLVGGYNFGTGSSREQAATALKHRGLAMIIAGSFSQTYKRNAFNNGYICIECPELIEDLKAAFRDDRRATIRTTWQATVDFQASKIATSTGRGASANYTFSPLGTVAQELVIKGGFEAVIREQIKK